MVTFSIIVLFLMAIFFLYASVYFNGKMKEAETKLAGEISLNEIWKKQRDVAIEDYEIVAAERDSHKRNLTEAIKRLEHLSYLLRQANNQNQSVPKPEPRGVTWLEVFGFASDDPINKEIVNKRYKDLAKVFHPDISGSEYAMRRLNKAKEIADKRFK